MAEEVYGFNEAKSKIQVVDKATQDAKDNEQDTKITNPTVTASVDADNKLTITVNESSATVELPRTDDIATDALISVIDVDGNVIEGAEISFISNDWNLDNVNVEIYNDGTILHYTVTGITGSIPVVTKIRFMSASDGYSYDIAVSNNNPNVVEAGSGTSVWSMKNFDTRILQLLDEDGNVIADKVGWAYTEVS